MSLSCVSEILGNVTLKKGRIRPLLAHPRGRVDVLSTLLPFQYGMVVFRLPFGCLHPLNLHNRKRNTFDVLQDRRHSKSQFGAANVMCQSEVVLTKAGRHLYPHIVVVYGCRKYDLSYVYGEGV